LSGDEIYRNGLSSVMCFEERGEGFGGRAENDFVEGVGVEGFFGANVDGADAALVGDLDKAGGGVDGAGGSYDEEDGGAVEFAVDGVHFEGDFAEPDDMRADGGMAGFADGDDVGVIVDGAVDEVLVGAGAAGLKEAAVHVVDAVRAGSLVEVVYVLGAEVEAVGIYFGEALFYFCEGFVASVGLGGEGIATALGVEAPDKFGVGLPGFGSGDLFYAMAVPEAAGAAEGGQAGFGGDAGAGEDEEAVLERQAHKSGMLLMIRETVLLGC
jgi:hypothetical protein